MALWQLRNPYLKYSPRYLLAESSNGIFLLDSPMLKAVGIVTFKTADPVFGFVCSLTPDSYTRPCCWRAAS